MSRYCAVQGLPGVSGGREFPSGMDMLVGGGGGCVYVHVL